MVSDQQDEAITPPKKNDDCIREEDSTGARVLSAIIAILLALFYLEAKGLPGESGVWPRGLIVAGFLLLLVYSAEEWLAAKYLKKNGKIAPASSLKLEYTREGLLSTATTTLMLCGFLLAVYLVGFFLSIVCFIMLYIWFHGGKKWLSSILISALAVGIFYALFGVILNASFFSGWIFSYL